MGMFISRYLLSSDALRPACLLLLGASLLAPSGHTVEANADANDSSVAQERDMVVMINGHRLSGTVSEHTDSHLTLSTEGGLLVISNERVASIDYAQPTVATSAGIDNPNQQSEEQLRLGAYRRALRLAQMAFATNKREQAQALLLPFTDILDLDGLRLLARLLDGAGQNDEALELYERYEKAGGKDRTTIKRLATIRFAHKQYQKKLKRYEKKYGSEAITEPEQIEPQQVENGLEANSGWRAEKPEFANPGKVTIFNDPVVTEDQIMQIDCTGGNKWKAAATLRLRVDATDSSLVTALIFNHGKRSVGISIAVKAGSRHQYYESVAQQIPASKEWASVTFNLKDDSFKSAKDNYRSHTHSISHLEDIRELQIQVHNRRHEAMVQINNIFFNGDKQPELIVVPEPSAPAIERKRKRPEPGITE